MNSLYVLLLNWHKSKIKTRPRWNNHQRKKYFLPPYQTAFFGLKILIKPKDKSLAKATKLWSKINITSPPISKRIASQCFSSFSIWCKSSPKIVISCHSKFEIHQWYTMKYISETTQFFLSSIKINKKRQTMKFLLLYELIYRVSIRHGQTVLS